MGWHTVFSGGLALPLPIELSAAVAGLTARTGGRDVAVSAAAISGRYRERLDSTAIDGPAAIGAYLLTRLPATYAALSAALGNLVLRAPGFSPRSLLDLGCGPGTASWAAVQAFPALDAVTMLDANPALLNAARELAATASHAAMQRARFIEGDISAMPPDAFDLVVLSYALTELPDARLAAAVESAWRACGGVLLVVEPGTPRDYSRLMAIRDELLAQGARIAAPCPHHGPCPIAAPDWCHFSVRLARGRDHRRLKGGTLGYEDEKFSYLAVARPGIELRPPAPRILARPIETKFDATLTLCRPDGARAIHKIAKRDKDAFRAVRRLDWGDVLDIE